MTTETQEQLWTNKELDISSATKRGVRSLVWMYAEKFDHAVDDYIISFDEAAHEFSVRLVKSIDDLIEQIILCSNYEEETDKKSFTMYVSSLETVAIVTALFPKISTNLRSDTNGIVFFDRKVFKAKCIELGAASTPALDVAAEAVWRVKHTNNKPLSLHRVHISKHTVALASAQQNN